MYQIKSKKVNDRLLITIESDDFKTRHYFSTQKAMLAFLLRKTSRFNKFTKEKTIKIIHEFYSTDLIKELAKHC